MSDREHGALETSDEKAFVNLIGVDVLRLIGIDTDAVFEFSLTWSVDCLPQVETWSYQKGEDGQLVVGRKGELIATGKMHQIDVVRFGSFLESLKMEKNQ